MTEPELLQATRATVDKMVDTGWRAGRMAAVATGRRQRAAERVETELYEAADRINGLLRVLEEGR